MSFRSALLLILGVFILQFSRVLFFGEVIFPHNNALEVGASADASKSRISNRYFSDESNVFIPELANNLRSDRRGWLATWNPSVQLGRPSYQGALSRAFVLTNLLSYFTSDPFVLYTALVLLTVILTAMFFLLFLRSLGLHMVACGCAAIGLAFTTPVSYWLCFVMFVSAICWPVCLLWLVTEFTRKPSWLVAFGLAFATYCLLLSSYPQVTILSVYLVAPYALIRVWGASGTGREKLLLLFALIGCAGVGLLASLPVYLDLFFTAKESARSGIVSDSFFLAILPSINSPAKLAGFLTSLFDWSWLGNAIDPNYPERFNGLSFTPVYGTLIWLSFFLKNRRMVWFWQIFLLLCLAGTVFPQVYLFAVHHLGFGLSRIQLAGGAMIPGFVLSAITLDAFLRKEIRLSAGLVLCGLVPVIGEALVALWAWHQFSIDAAAIAITFLLVATLLFSLRLRYTVLLIAIALASVFFYGRRLILSQPRHAIYTSSDLVQAIKARTPNGGRFAIANGVTEALPANEEALVNLNSVNSYDSLSSRRYQELTRQWSPTGAGYYGRYFRFVDTRKLLTNNSFLFSNVHLILSTRSITSGRLILVDDINGIKLYKPVMKPIDLRQTGSVQSLSSAAVIEPFVVNPELRAHRIATLSDFQRIKVTPSPQETLVFLSQQYHRAWRAEAHQRLLHTVIVNNFYQGVLVPPNTTEVALAFRPFVLWSWLPQFLFGIGGALLLFREVLRTKHGIKMFDRATAPTSSFLHS